MKKRIIYQKNNYRIIELLDELISIDDLKGDSFDPELVTHLSKEELLQQEREFENLVDREGVFGYALEVWNPSVDCGWTHVDSCFGFVGQFKKESEQFNHYIVDEFINQINKGGSTWPNK